MKIPVFHSFDSWQLSGVNTWSLNLEEAMRGDGRFENILLFTGEPYSALEELNARRVPYAHLELPAVRSRSDEWTALKGFLEANAPCIYVPNYDFHRSSAVPVLSSEVKVLLVVHSDEECYYESIARLGASADAVVAVSSTVERQLAARFPSLSSRLFRVPYGVPSTPGQRLQADPHEPLRLLYCNRLSQYQKRIFDLPKLCVELQRLGLDFHLTVAGAGADERELKSRFGDSGLVDKVNMVGLLSAEEVQQALLRSDVFLLVSDFEGLPISLLEAMSAGCVPVVYEIESGVRDAIENEVSGILVPHGDVAAMAREIVSLNSDRHRLEGISQGAMQRHAERFSLGRMSADYRELFSRLMADEAEVPLRDGRVRKSPDLTLRYRLLRRAGFLR